MKVPEKFPEGCDFLADFSGGDWVRFPDGRVFKLDEVTGKMSERPTMPRSAAPSDETFFVRAAAAASRRDVMRASDSRQS